MRRHRNQAQTETFIQFMRLHKNIAIGNVKLEGYENAEHLWKSLTDELNAKGPPVRDSEEWKQNWEMWKKSCLKKLTSPEGAREISDTEQAIIEICGMTSINTAAYESEENSRESTISTDTTLKKLTTVVVNSDNVFHIMQDPLKQENIDFTDASVSEAQFSNYDNFDDNNQSSQLKRRYRNPEQTNILLSFMQNHKEIARSGLRNKEDKNVKALWQKLADELNAWGPPTKNVNEWRMAWIDWRKFCRRNLRDNIVNGNKRTFTKQERTVIELSEKQKSWDNEVVADDDDEDCHEASVSNDTPFKRKSFLLDATENETAKKPKINEENSNDSYVENSTNEDLDEMDLHETNRALTPTSMNIGQSLTEIRSGVGSIQSSLLEICKLIAEQNQELKRLTAETRRHHFVMEKEMMKRKRENMHE